MPAECSGRRRTRANRGDLVRSSIHAVYTRFDAESGRLQTLSDNQRYEAPQHNRNRAVAGEGDEQSIVPFFLHRTGHDPLYS